TCHPLPKVLRDFHGKVNKNIAELNWTVTNNSFIEYFDLERSIDGIHFTMINHIENNSPKMNDAEYSSIDLLDALLSENVYYRLKIVGMTGSYFYSQTIRLMIIDRMKNGVTIKPNPANNW